MEKLNRENSGSSDENLFNYSEDVASKLIKK